MRRFINRTWSRTEHDDFVLNVQPQLGDYDEAMPAYGDNGQMLGWFIQRRYE